MRRLRKWLWITCVAGSVVVGVLAIGLGVRSYFRHDLIRYTIRDDSDVRNYAVTHQLGSIVFGWGVFPTEGNTMTRGWKIFSSGMARDHVLPSGWVWGFEWMYEDVRYGPHITRSHAIFAVPYWFILLLCLPAPVIAWRRRRKRLRIEREGLCRVCGYDLRASESRCPECGTPFTTSPETPLVGGIVLSKCDRPGNDPDFR